jgi:hypothetical protein
MGQGGLRRTTPYLFCTERLDVWSLLIVPQAEDISDDAISIVILDNEVWHRAMRGVQCSSKCRGRHSRNVGNFGERWCLLIYRPAILFNDEMTRGTPFARDRQALLDAAYLSRLCGDST